MKKNIFLNGFMSPIGKALAAKFKSNGYYVYGGDISEDYEGVCDRSLRFDINQFVTDAAYRIRFSQIFEELMPSVDVLINTGTDIKLSTLERIDLGNWQEALNVSLTGPLLLCKLLLQKLESKSGSIINISRIGDSHQGIGGNILYSALNGFATGVNYELQGKVGVYTISICRKHEEKGENDFERVSGLAYFLASDMSKMLDGTNFEVKIP